MEARCCGLKGILGIIGCLAACQAFTTKCQQHNQKCLQHGPIALGVTLSLTKNHARGWFHSNGTAPKPGGKKKKIRKCKQHKTKSRFAHYEFLKNSMISKCRMSKDSSWWHILKSQNLGHRGRKIKISRLPSVTYCVQGQSGLQETPDLKRKKKHPPCFSTLTAD